MYSIKKMPNSHWQILVNAVDDINDGLILIVDPAWKRITDVGYMFNELRICEHEISRKVRLKICEEFSSFYDCKFNEVSLQPAAYLPITIHRIIPIFTLYFSCFWGVYALQL